jgi:hypothetical protein
MGLVSERNILTEGAPLVGEVSEIFFGYRSCRVRRIRTILFSTLYTVAATFLTSILPVLVTRRHRTGTSGSVASSCDD